MFLNMALENNAKMYQLNKMNEEAIKHATSEFFKYIQVLGHKVDMNNLNVLPYQVYKEQESFYKDNNSLYRLASLFTVMFLQLGIIELDEEFPDIYIPPQY